MVRAAGNGLGSSGRTNVNTLKSATTIVVLLGVLYGVYIVLSKPDRLRELKLPGAPSGNSAQNDPGPQIDFGGAQPHLAVESGGSSGLSFETASPASPAPPPTMSAGANGFGAVEAPPASASALGSGSAYGGGSSAYGQTSTTPPAPPPSAYGQAPSAYGNSTPADNGNPNAGGYGVGSRYNVTSAQTGSLSDGPPPSAYGSNSGDILRTSGERSLPSHETSPAQGPYGSSSTGGSSYAPPSAAATGSTADAHAQVPTDALTEYSLRQMWSEAERLVAENKLKEALKLLTSHYSHPNLPAEQRAAMIPWLDALAARVIYSKAHLLEMPYEVRSKETLFDIQERFNVPWQLLQNINADVVKDPAVVVVGTPLKVLKGPFRAELELARGEITVFLDDMYAGRFPFTLGNEPVRPGSYQVADKRTDRAYYATAGVIAATDPTNPYGGVWIDLGREVSIHGSPQQATGEQLGCISLSPQDAKDLYGILSLSSEVVIR